MCSIIHSYTGLENLLHLPTPSQSHLKALPYLKPHPTHQQFSSLISLQLYSLYMFHYSNYKSIENKIPFTTSNYTMHRFLEGEWFHLEFGIAISSSGAFPPISLCLLKPTQCSLCICCKNSYNHNSNNE